MKKIVFGDGQEIAVQSLAESEGVMHIRMIQQTAEALKMIFDDSATTDLMTLYDNVKVVGTYEHFTIRKYIKEETGGIWEVEMCQAEADTNAKIAALQAENATLAEQLAGALEELTNTQLALCEVYEMLS